MHESLQNRRKHSMMCVERVCLFLQFVNCRKNTLYTDKETNKELVYETFISIFDAIAVAGRMC